MNYEEAMEYLSGLTKFGVNLGLGRIKELLRRLGDPHLKLTVVHIAGTNGKGSTAAMITSVLKESGFSTGTFTSPHLYSYNERFRINGRAIADRGIAELITILRPHLDNMVADGYEHPTEFEVGTAMAFLYFYREKVDFVVLEAGMGGEIDSTNVVKPAVSVITNVSMDHMEYLGRTVREIARVKAGIIKKGVPLVTAAQGEALAVILKKSEENGVPVTLVGRDICWRQLGHDLRGQRLNICSRKREYKNLFLPLLGIHQLENAATATAAAEVLAGENLICPDFALERGLAATFWPGRMEIAGESPTVIIDAAHNHDGAINLRKTLDEYFPGKKPVLVIGMLGDKERSKVVAELAAGAKSIIVTRPVSHRSGDWRALAEEALKYTTQVEIIENISRAVHKGLDSAEPKDLVVITGSIYMIAEARRVLGLREPSNSTAGIGGAVLF